MRRKSEDECISLKKNYIARNAVRSHWLVGLTGNIRTRKVDQARLLWTIVNRYRQRLVGHDSFDMTLEEGRRNLAHNESRSLNAHFLNNGVVLPNFVNDDLCQLLRTRHSRRHGVATLLQAGKSRHGNTALVVAVFGTVALLDNAGRQLEVGSNIFYHLGKNRCQYLRQTGIGL